MYVQKNHKTININNKIDFIFDNSLFSCQDNKITTCKLRYDRV